MPNWMNAQTSRAEGKCMMTNRINGVHKSKVYKDLIAAPVVSCDHHHPPSEKCNLLLLNQTRTTEARKSIVLE